VLIFAYIAFFFLLIITFLQDVKDRAVDWYIFPLLLISVVFIRWIEGNSILANTGELLFNSAFILFQISSLFLYLFIKERKLSNIINQYLGLGDILFWVVLAVFLQSVSFLLFYSASIFFIVLMVGVRRVVKKEIGTIPLAGLQAAILIPCVAFHLMGYNVLNRSLNTVGELWTL